MRYAVVVLGGKGKIKRRNNMTREELIFELKKRCSFWLNNKTISKKHALECLCGILEKEEFQSSLPSNLDEAAKKIAYDVCKQLPNGTEKDNIVYYAILAAKAGADLMAGQSKTI